MHRYHGTWKETISPVKELLGARKKRREDGTRRSLPPGRNLEGFLDEAVPRAVLKTQRDLGEEGCRRDGMWRGGRATGQR